MVTRIICQACGAEATPQSEEIMNGREDLYSCPNCKQSWQPLSTGLFEEEEIN